MATLEDVQDVAAARRAHAEAKAELAEFEESQQAANDNLIEKSNSKYFEIIDHVIELTINVFHTFCVQVLWVIT